MKTNFFILAVIFREMAAFFRIFGLFCALMVLFPAISRKKPSFAPFYELDSVPP